MTDRRREAGFRFFSPLALPSATLDCLRTRRSRPFLHGLTDRSRLSRFASPAPTGLDFHDRHGALVSPGESKFVIMKSKSIELEYRLRQSQIDLPTGLY